MEAVVLKSILITYGGCPRLEFIRSLGIALIRGQKHSTFDGVRPGKLPLAVFRAFTVCPDNINLILLGYSISIKSECSGNGFSRDEGKQNHWILI